MTAPAATETQLELEHIPVAILRDHPANPRKNFDKAQLDELTASVREKGVLVPLSVRHHEKGYQILGGARRLRAAKAAGIDVVPCLVRDVDDDTALELVVLDNLQRADLHPLEEAHGFHDLQRRPGYDVAKVAARVGRSVQYVYDRLKLLSLTKDAQELFLAGRFTAGHAILLARLSPADQARAIKPEPYADLGLFREDMGDVLFNGRDARRKDPFAGMTVSSVRELAAWIRDNVRADFKAPETAELFPDAARAIEEAVGAQTKVVQISNGTARDHELKGEKVYYTGQWRPADGKHRYRNDSYAMVVGKKCKSAVLGVVVIGDGRGEAFDVCVDRSCATHWKKKASTTKGNAARNTAARAKQQAREEEWERQRKERAALQDRWKKAVPALREAVAAGITKASLKTLGDMLIEEVGARNGTKPLIARGQTAEDLVRHAVSLALASRAAETWQIDNFVRDAKKLGVDAIKVVDAAVPPVQTSGKPATKKVRKKK